MAQSERYLDNRTAWSQKMGISHLARRLFAFFLACTLPLFALIGTALAQQPEPVQVTLVPSKAADQFERLFGSKQVPPDEIFTPATLSSNPKLREYVALKSSAPDAGALPQVSQLQISPGALASLQRNGLLIMNVMGNGTADLDTITRETAEIKGSLNKIIDQLNSNDKQLIKMESNEKVIKDDLDRLHRDFVKREGDVDKKLTELTDNWKAVQAGLNTIAWVSGAVGLISAVLAGIMKLMKRCKANEKPMADKSKNNAVNLIEKAPIADEKQKEQPPPSPPAQS